MGLKFWIAPVTRGDPLDCLPHRVNTVRPGFPGFAMARSQTSVPLSNFIMVQQQNNISSWCFWGGTPNKGNAELLHPGSLSTWESVATAPVCLSVRPPGWCQKLSQYLQCKDRCQFTPSSLLLTPPRAQPATGTAASHQATCTKYILQHILLVIGISNQMKQLKIRELGFMFRYIWVC